MIKGYSKHNMGRIALGTHLGDFSHTDSEKYINAVKYAIRNGISTIDGAINYRGMRSEKDEGTAINQLIEAGEIKREDIFITSKAGLLFGDVEEGLNPQKCLKDILEPKGVTIDDFTEYEGLLQTLNPRFFEIALNKSLQNLGVETLDLHYIHIPEISRLGLSEEEFYTRIQALFSWYESKVSEGKLRFYGIAFEFMTEEPQEAKWHIELEKIKQLAEKVSVGENHLKYILFEYNLLSASANMDKTQTVKGEQMTMIDACRKLGFETVASMPFAMGDGFEKYSVEEMLSFALNSMEHVIVGSKNVKHIQEIIDTARWSGTWNRQCESAG